MEIQRLAYMANQIARNLAARGEDEAVADIAQHIADFWDPRMKAAIQQASSEMLDPLVLRALGRKA